MTGASRWPAASQTALMVLAQTGTEERVTMSLAIPSTPVLRGTAWFLQPLMLQAGGAAYLADPTSFHVF
jgi:hypothetical protein